MTQYPDNNFSDNVHFIVVVVLRQLKR